MLFLKEKTASTVTVQVQLKDMQSTIAGANFQDPAIRLNGAVEKAFNTVTVI